MCIVTSEEQEAEKQYWLSVTKTNIFARHTRPDYQAIVYSLSITANSRAAMILPLPVLPNSGDKALSFIDLSSYPDIFDDMSLACPPEIQHIEFNDDMMFLSDDLDVRSAELLTVHKVGDYEASYVPTMADFDRLDPCFRLPNDVWHKMPDYSDYGFAVFQLLFSLSEGDTIENSIHPMAFEFHTRDNTKLYFPTVHVHDGSYHKSADFYHKFYCQRDNARAEFKYQRETLQGVEPTFDDEPIGYQWFYCSQSPIANNIDMTRCAGLVDAEQPLFAMDLLGQYTNIDLWMGDTIKERFAPIQVPDIKTAKKVVKMSPEALAPQLKYLLEHFRNADADIIAILAPYLASLGKPLIPHIKKALVSGHGPWVRSILMNILANWDRSQLFDVTNELLPLLSVPQIQTRLTALTFCAKYKIGNFEQLCSMNQKNQQNNPEQAAVIQSYLESW